MRLISSEEVGVGGEEETWWEGRGGEGGGGLGRALVGAGWLEVVAVDVVVVGGGEITTENVSLTGELIGVVSSSPAPPQPPTLSAKHPVEALK